MDSMCALCLRASGPQGAGKARRQNEGLTEIVQSGLKTALARREQEKLAGKTKDSQKLFKAV